MIVIAVMPVFYLFIFYFLLPMSPRFLFSAGRNEDGKKALRQIAKHYPKANIDDKFIDQVEYSTGNAEYHITSNGVKLHIQHWT